MGIRALRRHATSDEYNGTKPMRRQGVGGLLLLVGAGLIGSESSGDGSQIGGGLGFLLVLVGAGLILDRQPEGRVAP